MSLLDIVAFCLYRQCLLFQGGHRVWQKPWTFHFSVHIFLVPSLFVRTSFLQDPEPHSIMISRVLTFSATIAFASALNVKVQSFTEGAESDASNHKSDDGERILERDVPTKEQNVPRVSTNSTKYTGEQTKMISQKIWMSGSIINSLPLLGGPFARWSIEPSHSDVRQQ
jgi:hypothetical protein